MASRASYPALLILGLVACLAPSHQRVELHVHLDGATSFETLFEVASKRNLTLPAGVNSTESLQKYCGTFQVTDCNLPDSHAGSVSQRCQFSFLTHLSPLQTTGFKFFVCVLDFLGGDAWSIALAAERFVAFQASKNITYTEVRYAPSTLATSPKYGFKITPAAAVDAVTRGLRRGLAAHPGLEMYQILCVDQFSYMHTLLD